MGSDDAERQLAVAEAYYQIETIHLAMGRLAGMSALLPLPPMFGSSLEYLIRCFIPDSLFVQPCQHTALVRFYKAPVLLEIMLTDALPSDGPFKLAVTDRSAISCPLAWISHGVQKS